MNTDSTNEIRIDQEYMKMQDFMKFLEFKEEDNPYDCVMSFDKYIRSIKTQYEQGCKFSDSVVPYLEDVESKMQSNKVEVCQHLQSEASSMLMPSMFVQNEMSFIGKPFHKKFSQATSSLTEFLNNPEWEIKVDAQKLAVKNNIIGIGSYILNECYGINAFQFNSDNLEFRNTKTGLIKHLEIAIKTDFIEVIQKKPLLPLSQDDIRKLMDNNMNPEVWLELLPPDRFQIKGFVIGTFHDITRIQIHSQMREHIATIADDSDANEKMKEISLLFKSYLNDESIEVGMANFLFMDLVNSEAESFSLTKELDIRKIINPDLRAESCLYSKAIKENQPVLCDDLESRTMNSPAEKKLLKNGIQSIILIPICNSDDNKLISILEIGSTNKMGVNKAILFKLKEMIGLMELMVNTFTKEMDKLVDLIIRDHFTSIHPSVEWKFKEVATKHQLNLLNQTGDSTLDPIRFEHVYPLYGQADIVGSSTLRNEALREDLLFNLNALNNLIQIWLDNKHLFLLSSYQIKVKEIIQHLEKGFDSTDESTIIELLHSEIHPLLEELKGRHDDLPSSPYAEYISILDSEFGIVYNKRKLYEESVTTMNSHISEHFSKADAVMQKTLPHYFEKYKTDGVEYNIYLGQSLLEDGTFSDNDLREFRIWQIQNMVEVTQKVERLSPTLPVPITTAQLIFVYNNELNIKFRMEEKKFDVDGAYNVRYEILKKRIDKATIKGTDERLTVTGKIAIVYLQEREKREYLKYIEFLKHSGQIEEEVEELELNKLPGAEGLKALRITVKKVA
ncbi:MAG: hypothetical protein AAGA77_05195 [Bacteroidota bacterium]